MTALLATLLLALQPASPPALAAPPKASYRAHRAPSCGEWRRARTGRGATPLLEAGYNIWFHGYVTGFNVHGPDARADLLGSTKWAEIGAFMDDYCARNPSHLIADALAPLAADLIGRRAATPAAPAVKRHPAMTVKTTCGEWTKGRDDALLRVMSGGAARGYLTAYNRWGPEAAGDVLGPGNDALIDRWIDNWCRGRPRALLMESLPPLIVHLKAERAAGRLAAGGTPANEQVVPTVRDRP